MAALKAAIFNVHLCVQKKTDEKLPFLNIEHKIIALFLLLKRFD